MSGVADPEINDNQSQILATKCIAMSDSNYRIDIISIINTVWNSDPINNKCQNQNKYKMGCNTFNSQFDTCASVYERILSCEENPL